MSTVQPPPPLSTAVAPITAQALAIVLKAPHAIANLIPGQGLLASVTTQAQSSAQSIAQSLAQPHLIQTQTTLGPVSLQTTMAIPQNAVLSLVLTKQGPQPTFVIAEINGKPVAAAKGALKAATGQVETAKAGQPAPLSPGMQLNAALLRPALAGAALFPATQFGSQPLASPSSTPPTVAPANAAAAGQTPATIAASATPASSGSALQGQIQAFSPPQPAGAPQSPPASAPTLPPTPNPPATPSAQSPQTAQGTAAQPSGTQTSSASPSVVTTPGATTVGPHATWPSGTRFAVSISRIDGPSTALNTPTTASSPGLAQGAVVSGTVRGATPQGQPIVQSPTATLALDTRAPVADGTRVVLKLETMPVPPRASDGATLGRAGPTETLVQAKVWSDLDEALKALSTIDPARFQQVAQTALPQPGAKLTAQMLFFLSALKGGDFQAWLGDNASRLIERERPGMLTRLGADFQVMSKLADEPQQNDWRLALVPFLNGERVEQLRLYYRGGGGGGEDEAEEGKRFVLDVDLSNIGHVQIDGLVKSEQKRLDLIIRTDQPLNEEWRAEIADVFVAAQDLIGLQGGVGFQAAPGNFIEFSPVDTAEPHPGLFA